MEFGARIRKRRKAMGLTLEDLAKKAGCSAGALCRFENGYIPREQGRGVIARVKKILKVRFREQKKRSTPVTPPPIAIARPAIKALPSQEERVIKSLTILHTRLDRIEAALKNFPTPAQAPAEAA